MVRVCLGTDESPVKAHADLFEQRMGQIVHGPQLVGNRQVIAVHFLQLQFYLEEATIEIDVIFLWVYLKLDGIDTRGVGLNGD